MAEQPARRVGWEETVSLPPRSDERLLLPKKRTADGLERERKQAARRSDRAGGCPRVGLWQVGR